VAGAPLGGLILGPMVDVWRRAPVAPSGQGEATRHYWWGAVGGSSCCWRRWADCAGSMIQLGRIGCVLRLRLVAFVAHELALACFGSRLLFLCRRRSEGSSDMEGYDGKGR
jgi:hypothetical protein